MIPLEELKNTKEILHSCLPLFIALGDEIRQQMILDIAAHGERGMNVTEITENYSLSRPAISHHLKVLKDYGLVATRKEGTQVFYRSIVHENLGKLSEFITSIEHVIESLERGEK